MNFYAECRRIHAMGLVERAKGGYEHGRIPFTLIPFRANGTPMKPIMDPGGLSDEGRHMLKRLPALFALMNVSAALIQSDSMFVQSPKFTEYFGLSPSLSLDAYSDEFRRILDEKFEGTMANLPRELWRDAIFTCVKGPKVPMLMISHTFKPDADGRVIYEPYYESANFEANILPDWWGPTVQ